MTVAANSSTSVSFAAFTLADAYVRGTVRAGTDPMPQDNTFHFVLTPGRPVSVLVVTPREASGDRDDPSLYLSKALSIGTTPAFQVDVTSAGAHDAGDARQAGGGGAERHAVSAGRWPAAR